MKRQWVSAAALVLTFVAAAVMSGSALALSPALPPLPPNPPPYIGVSTESGRQLFVLDAGPPWPGAPVVAVPPTVTLHAGELVRFDLLGLYRTPDAATLTVGGPALDLAPGTPSWQAQGAGGRAVLSFRFDDSVVRPDTGYFLYDFVANVVIEPDFTPLCTGWNAAVDRLATRLGALQGPAARSAPRARARIRALVGRLTSSHAGYRGLISAHCA
jgi:hypothetical protein